MQKRATSGLGVEQFGQATIHSSLGCGARAPSAILALLTRLEPRTDGGFDVTTTDPTLDRLLRHMAWANAALFDTLAAGSDEDLALAAPRNEWPAGRILAHLVGAAARYAARLEGLARPDEEPPVTAVAELADLKTRCAAYDARIRAQAALPDGPAQLCRTWTPIVWRAIDRRSRQAIHHATEHRAQIAGALATNGIDTIDLDALDLWAFTEAEDGRA